MQAALPQSANAPDLRLPMAAALALRLAWLLLILHHSGPRALLRPDTLSYWIPGHRLLTGLGFSTPAGPELIRTPGYALLLGFFGQIGPATVALAQILLSLLTVWLTARLAWQLFNSQRIAWLAALFLALDPLSLCSAIPLLSEPLAVALTIASLERLAAALQRRSLPALSSSAILLAASALTRPANYYLPFCLALYLFLILRYVRRVRWLAPGILLLFSLPWLLLWQVRNGAVAHYTGFSAVAPRNLYFYNAAEVKAAVEGKTLAEAQNELGYHDTRFDQLPQAARWTFMQQQALDILRAHPGLALRLSLAGSLRTALNPGAAIALALWRAQADEQSPRLQMEKGALKAVLWSLLHEPGALLLRLIFLLWLLALYLLAGFGMRRWSQDLPALLLLAGTVLYYLALGAGAAGSARMRLPAMPALVILAALGLSEALKKHALKQRERQRE